MNMKKYLDDLGNLGAENKLLKFSVACLVMIAIVQAYATVKALGRQRTILLPPGVSSKMELSGDTANEAYLREFARYATGLALNVTPHTARGNFDELLAIYSPRTWGKGRSSLYKMAADIEMAKVSTVFFPQSIKPFEKEGRIEIAGHRNVYTEDLLVESGKKTYVFRYELVDGNFQLLGFAEKADERLLEDVINAGETGNTEDASTGNEGKSE